MQRCANCIVTHFRFLFSKPKRLLISLACLPPGVGAWVLLWACLSICLSHRVYVCSLILGTTSSDLANFLSHVMMLLAVVSVCLRRRWDTTCNSGFVDDVMFGDNRPGEGCASRASTRWLIVGQRQAGGWVWARFTKYLAIILRLSRVVHGSILCDPIQPNLSAD